MSLHPKSLMLVKYSLVSNSLSSTLISADVKKETWHYDLHLIFVGCPV